MIGVVASAQKMERQETRITALRVERDALARQLTEARAECERPNLTGFLRTDIDVAHRRLDDLELVINAVAATVPGRSRAPNIPKRNRPTVPGEAE
jgi:hypothetical protein